MKFRNISISALSLFAITLTTTSIYHQNKVIVKALTPMPTSINMTISEGSELENYYESVQTKKGDELLASLYEIIKDHNEYNYESTTHRYIYKIIDRNWELSPLTSAELSDFNYSSDNPYIRKLYADYNDDISTADRFQLESSVSFDKEHIWPQSLGAFGRTGGAGSDFHSLLPSDTKANRAAHSNNNLGVPSSSITNYMSDKDTYVGRNGFMDGGGEKVFEPLDAYKGDVARAMFYMVARYYEYVDALHPKLRLVNGSPSAVTASPTQDGLAGDLATLLEWHILDPVDDYEIRRNNLIYHNYQGNRNPFIDYPAWVAIAFDSSYTGEGAAFEYEEDALVGLEVRVKEGTTFTFMSELSASQFEVRAIYGDESTKLVTNFTVEVESGGSRLIMPGRTSIKISYQEGNVIRSATIEIDVIMTTPQYMIIAGLLVVLLIASISFGYFYNRSKRLRKKTKKVIKKVTKAVKKKK